MNSKVYGTGSYSALRVGSDSLLILASGQRPALNITPVLEQLPWRIWPPHFGLFFESSGDFGAPAITDFSIALLTPYPPELDSVTIIDANGPHLILFDILGTDSEAPKAVHADWAHYAVFQDLNDSANCLIAPVDAIVPATLFNATKSLGPLTYQGAVQWKAANCKS